MKNNLYLQGFTLVELAIVMVIIGLLISGILKGQELITQAKIKKTVSMVQGYTGALNTFKDKYNSLPGDTPFATARIPGCGTCINGNGDSFVGLPLTSPSGGQANVNSLPEVETTMFWKELGLADLIVGIDTSAPVSPASFGVTHPTSPLGGGFSINHLTVASASGPIGDWGVGIVLVMHGAPNNMGSTGGAVSPLIARQLDTQMDDGNSDTGMVTADYVINGCEVGGGVYENRGDSNCVLYFNLGR